MLRPSRLSKISCVFPKKYLGKVIDKLQDVGIVHLVKSEQRNGFVHLKPDDKEFHELSSVLKRVNELVKLMETNTFRPFIRQFFGPGHIRVPTKDHDSISKIADKLIVLEKQYNDLKFAKAGLNISDYNQLLLLRDTIEDRLDRHKALQMLSESKYVLMFEGWIEYNKVNRVRNVMDIATDKKCVFSSRFPEANESVPTKFDNFRLIRPFEVFTEYYGIPGYKEIDPTLLIAISFTVMFGIVFADFGYGLGLSFLSVIVYLYTTKESRFRKNLNLALIYFGLSSMFFGFLFGEFFGMHFRRGIIDPVGDIVLFLLISVAAGLVHMSIGILSKAMNNLKNPKIMLHSLSLILIMWPAFSLYFYPYSFVNRALALAGIFSLIVLKKFEALKEISSIIIGAVSYMRIAILGLAHVIINRLLVSMFSNLSESVLEFAIFSAIFLVGSFAILTIGVLIASLQVLRLHWLEFFSQFFVGKGYKFEPFRHSINYK